MSVLQPCFLFVISAPSGAGKTTLCQKLLEDFSTLTLSISSTTRAPRGTEQHGIDYYFMSPDEFKKEIEAGQFAEWALVHGNYYGTSKKVIQDAFLSGKSVLLDIDVQGAEQLKKTFPKECLKFFIAPPSLSELEARLRKRGTDSEESIQKRLKNAKMEIEEGRHFDHVIINDSFDRAYTELQSIVRRYLSQETASTLA